MAHSEETKKKIGIANRGVWIKFKCDNCGKENEEKHNKINYIYENTELLNN